MARRKGGFLFAAGAAAGALLPLLAWFLSPDALPPDPGPRESPALHTPPPPEMEVPSERPEAPFDPASLLDPYEGKYAGDPAFRERALRLAAAVPGAVEQIRAQLRLGDIAAPRIRVRFHDAGDVHPDYLAQATWEVQAGRMVQVITVVAERLAADGFDVPQLVLHETAHCWQRHLLGTRMDGMPRWLVEGLADWVSLEGEEHRIRVFCSIEFNASGDIRDVLDLWHADFLRGETDSFSGYAYAQLAVRYLRLLDPPGDGDAFLHRLFTGARGRSWKVELLRSTGLTFPEFAERLRPWAERQVLAFLRNRDRFLAARALKEDGKWAEATAAYDAFAAEFPVDALVPRARYEAAYCRYMADEYADSLVRLDALAGDWPDTELDASIAWLRFRNVDLLSYRFPVEMKRALSLGEAYLRNYSYRSEAHLDLVRKQVKVLRFRCRGDEVRAPGESAER